MKLLLDTNLSPEVGCRLKEAGHEAIHVADIGLLSAPDPEILQAAAEARCRLAWHVETGIDIACQLGLKLALDQLKMTLGGSTAADRGSVRAQPSPIL